LPRKQLGALQSGKPGSDDDDIKSFHKFLVAS
jgi:hypothetical protein